MDIPPSGFMVELRFRAGGGGGSLIDDSSGINSVQPSCCLSHGESVFDHLCQFHPLILAVMEEGLLGLGPRQAAL